MSASKPSKKPITLRVWDLKENKGVDWNDESNSTDKIVGRLMDRQLKTEGVALTTISTSDSYTFDVRGPEAFLLYYPPLEYDKYKEFGSFEDMVKYLARLQKKKGEKLYVYKEYYFNNDKGWVFYQPLVIPMEKRTKTAVPRRRPKYAPAGIKIPHPTKVENAAFMAGVNFASRTEGADFSRIYEINIRGLVKPFDMTVPYSEMAMHGQIAGGHILAIGFSPSRRSAVVSVKTLPESREYHGNITTDASIPGEVLSIELRRVLSKFPGFEEIAPGTLK